MLETDDKVGEGICGFCATRYAPPDDATEPAGEYADISAGEPRSDTVWHPTVDGVASVH